MSNYSYKPIQTYFDAFKRRETISQDVRYPNNIAYAIIEQSKVQHSSNSGKNYRTTEIQTPFTT